MHIHEDSDQLQLFDPYYKSFIATKYLNSDPCSTESSTQTHVNRALESVDG